MSFFEYPITHPYPQGRRFDIASIIFILVSLALLSMVNVVTNGYELVPTLSATFDPNMTSSWHQPAQWYWGHKQKTPCQPKDLGRGDTIRLSPSLFEYKVISAWNSTNIQDPSNEARIPYTGASFNACFPYQAQVEYNMAEYSATVVVGVKCSSQTLTAFMETSVTVSADPYKDVTTQYWGFATDLDYFLGSDTSIFSDYRRTVFAVLDIISSDLFAAFSAPQEEGMLLLNAQVTETYKTPSNGFGYNNSRIATVASPRVSGNATGTYRSSIFNLVHVVATAVFLDLGNIQPENFFINRSAVAEFIPNPLPTSVPRTYTSFLYGDLPGNYTNWANALRDGYPPGIALGNMTQLPGNSVMETNYLCSSYQRKHISSFISSVFVGTATMFFSVWGVWTFATALYAKKIKPPCITCTCDKGQETGIAPSQTTREEYVDANGRS